MAAFFETGKKMRRYEILIFFTGSVTLSLEVLASRIMTPYFGVSLYIWSGNKTLLAFPRAHLVRAHLVLGRGLLERLVAR